MITSEAGAWAKVKLKQRLRVIIIGTSTPEGRLFDVVLLVLILISMALVLLDSVNEVRIKHGRELRMAEFIITGLFTLEYLVRVWIRDRRWRYVLSFCGLVELLAVIPTWLSLIFPGTQALAVVRALRLTRVFRALNLFPT